MIGRRGFITGLISLVAAPAIVRAGSLMPVKVPPSELVVYGESPGAAALRFMRDLDEMRERISRAFFLDLGMFGSAAIEYRQDGTMAHIPIGEIYR